MQKLIIIIFMCVCWQGCKTSQSSIKGKQNDEIHNDSTVKALQGRAVCISTVCVFSLTNDSILKKSIYPVTYPLLIVNNVPILNETLINCFRNNIDRKKIKRIRHITKEKAEKIGVNNVPNDGILVVTTKKGYIWDLNCKK